MKALSDDCEQFMCFPPGHIYSSKQGLYTIRFEAFSFVISLRHFRFVVSLDNIVFPCCFLVGGLRRWYNPPWYSEQVPSTPYDPLVLRNAFEKVWKCECLLQLLHRFLEIVNVILLSDLSQAVIKRLMTDVPFGVLLSGGLDSSLVAAVALRHLEKSEAGQWGAQLHTFCIGLKVIISYSS